MGIVEAKKLIFEYIRRDEEGNVEGITRAVDEVDLDVKQGDFVAVLGHNGSGKSTLAKHLNAILYPTEGTVWVDGKDTSEEKYLWEIRQTAGMVFQNPDNRPGSGRRCGIRPREYGCAYEGDLGEGGGKPEGRRHVSVPETFAE